MKHLPLSGMEKLLKLAGSKRVAETAKNELRSILEKKLNYLTNKAVVFSKHAHRKTIKKQDVKLSID